MFIGISQNTDMHYRRTEIHRFRTEKAARAWLADDQQGLAYPAAASGELRVTQQNWHRRIRSAYELPKGFRLNRKAISGRLSGYQSSTYRTSTEDLEASQYSSAAVRELHENALHDRWKAEAINVERRESLLAGYADEMIATFGAWRISGEIGSSNLWVTGPGISHDLLWLSSLSEGPMSVTADDFKACTIQAITHCQVAARKQDRAAAS